MGRATKGRQAMPSLEIIKASYGNARNNGDKEEEARWANQLGHAFKDRGEYVTALKWFRKDYEISSSGSGRLDPAKLMPTCQSIGEVYLRLQSYDDALDYQHKHLHWAEQAGNIVEQQRASTQLGRTYLELYEVKERNSAWLDAKAYFQTSLELARRLRVNPPASHTSPSGFVIEQVDAYNNLGLVRALSEDFKQALKFYRAGLKLCDEEEVDENDAARSRIHHNLGRLYAELRDWEKAKYHTELDVEICQKIPHAQGEAKGLMNLADLYFKSQDYEQTTRCYKRALHIARTLEDEDALISQLKSNLEIVQQAKAQMKAFDADMQKLSKLRREVESSKGTAAERKYIKQECALLLELTGRAEDLQSWEVHLGLAKRLKKLTKGLGDIEKLGDAFELVASSYYSLRNFQKSKKWHLKSFELCQRIGHLEGQIVSKINYGNALDASGDASGALTAYQEAFEAAKTGSVKMLTQQISALENIHYCYFVRLERQDEARKVEFQLQQLRHARGAPEAQDVDDGDERCSETDSEGPTADSPMSAASICDSDDDSPDRFARRERIPNLDCRRFNVMSDSDESDNEHAPLSSINSHFRGRRLSETTLHTSQTNLRKREPAARPVPTQEKRRTQQTQLFRARTRSQFGDRMKRALSDDEEREGSLEVELGRRQGSKSDGDLEDNHSAIHSGDSGDTRSKKKYLSSKRTKAVEHVVLSSDDDMPISSRKKRKLSNSYSRPSSGTDRLGSPLHELEDEPAGDNDWLHAINSPMDFRNANVSELGSKFSEGRPGRIPSVNVGNATPSAEKTREAVVQTEKSGPKDEEGLAGVASNVPFTVADEGPALAYTIAMSGPLKDRGGPRKQTSSVQGWTNTSLLESYFNHCSNGPQFTPTSVDLVKKLRSQKVPEEVVVAGCNMQDSDARPLLAALKESDAFSLLDMSHNQLGNVTVHAIQELIKSTGQADLGLTLDLHCNRLGAGALLEICRCPVSLSRLEVLNLSGNRLTDAAARHLSKILKESQALATLNLESCALTTRAITQLSSALHPHSLLNKLCIGNNTPIASHAFQELFHQLSTLAWFSYLDLKGIELDSAAVTCLCIFLEKSRRIAGLILQNTAISNDGALSIADALSSLSHCLEKLDLSLNCFNDDPAATLCARVMSIQRLSNLNLSGNHLGAKAAEILAEGLARPDCRLKALDISKCHLGQSSVLLIMQSLTGQTTLLDLNVADNIVPGHLQLLPLEDSAITHRPVEFNDGDAENRSKRESSTKTRASAEEYCRLLERELAAADADPLDADPSGAASTDDREGGQQSEEMREANLLPHKAESISPKPRDEDPVEILSGDATGPQGLARDLVYAMKSEVSLTRVQPGSAGPEQQTSGADLCTEGVLKSKPDADGKLNDQERVGQTGQACRSSASGRESAAGSDAAPAATATNDSMAITTTSAGAGAHAFCEQLAKSICKAKGLQRLDLSNNAIVDGSNIDVLYSAWSACPRGASSDHELHVEGSVLHFYVKERPCPCAADSVCCATR